MILFLIIGALCVIFYLVFIRPLTYWSNKGVLQLSVSRLIWENLKVILQLSTVAENLKTINNVFPGVRYFGIYHLKTPLLIIKDPELIKQLTVKDFDHFTDHSAVVTEDIEPLLGKNLFSLKGDRWKEMRATLSPSFTSSKMKGMFDLMSECAQNFVQHFQHNNLETVTVEFKDIFTRYTNDIIASTSFGITCNSLEERDNEFYTMGKEVTNFNGFWRNLSFFIMMISPRLANFMGVRIFSEKISTFFRNLVVGNMEKREQNNIVRPDMIHLLMQARKGKLKHETHTDGVIDSGFAVMEESTIGKEEKLQKIQLTDDDITAQALIFFFAGFESVSILMCFSAYELAVNPSIQQKLQEEVDKTLKACNGILTYEMLLKMEYLDMVVSETLRKWPSGIATDRVCIKPYTIPPEREGEKPIHLQKGDILFISLYSMHHDKNFFPEPDRFDPERFNHENKGNIDPYTYTPFGIGPRSCIGNRFALLESKVLLFHILKKFEIVVISKSVVPIKLNRKQFSLNAEDGFWFGLKPRKLIS